MEEKVAVMAEVLSASVCIAFVCVKSSPMSAFAHKEFLGYKQVAFKLMCYLQLYLPCLEHLQYFSGISPKKEKACQDVLYMR